MMRSLYSGITGLRNHQTRMDVIGNNIANVNTIGFKSSRVMFQDVFSQTANLGSANTGPVGGTNPIQIGLGMRLSTVDVIHTASAIQRTENPLDVMINGDGMIVVEGPDGVYFTRAGNFAIDDEGYVVTSHGYYVLGFVSTEALDLDGWPEDPNDPESMFPNLMALRDGLEDVNSTDRVSDMDPELARRIMHPNNFDDVDGNDVELTRLRLRTYWIVDPETGEYILQEPDDPESELRQLVGFSVGADGTVSVLFNNINTPIAQLAVAVFSNYNGLEKAGSSLYRETRSSGEAIITEARDQGAGEYLGGGLEMSNVDLSAEFTDMIVTQRGFQANSRIITVSDTMLEELVNLKR